MLRDEHQGAGALNERPSCGRQGGDMPLHASTEELRLALAALAAAASGLAAVRCRDIMDAASDAAADAPREAIAALSAKPSARLGAVRVLTTLCMTCGACPRGHPERLSGERMKA